MAPHHEVLNNGGNVQRAYSQINWEGAGKDALLTGVISLLTAVFTKILAGLDFPMSIVERFFTNFIVETPEPTKVSGITAEAW